MTQTNIFISYARSDTRELALKLRDDLQASGYSVWLDTSEIIGGDDWVHQLETAIDACHVLLALMSPGAQASRWCRAEHMRAMRKGKQVIPLRAVPDADLPFQLEHLNFLDFSSLDSYESMFRDLLSDIRAVQAFRQDQDDDPIPGSPYKPVRSSDGRRVTGDEKRSAPGFRRALRQLRAEPWLGSRFWWPSFLFHYTDASNLVQVLSSDELKAPVARGEDFNKRWDRFVRLYFRPRTPGFFHAEGFRPRSDMLPADYAPLPVYLLFDMETIVLHPEARFSDGPPEKTGKTYRTPTFFRELPFEQIYHDSWFTADEREEIMRFREAQVLIPDRLSLEALQYIWLRSEAEYETLHRLLPPEVWNRWRDKITARTDYQLFNARRVHVERATLEPDHIRLQLNNVQRRDDGGPFHMCILVEGRDGQRFEQEQADFRTSDLIQFTLPQPMMDYQVTLWLDGEIAYSGARRPLFTLL